MKWFYTSVCWSAAFAIFYGMFFKLAPYICTLIPLGQWNGLLKVGAYLLVAYFGGIGIPIILVVFSTVIFLKASEY